ncbi:phosphopantetheine-binding protein [Streptococcus suis]|nr:phosphopantetheine-binding protein [Streptococcus suis]
MKEQVYQKIVAMLQEQKGKNFSPQLNSLLENDIVADSVETMEFVLTLEDEFNLAIPDVAIEQFETLSDVVDFIWEESQKRS